MSAPQLDLFGAPPRPAAKPEPPKLPRHHFPTPPTMAWARELTAAGEVGHAVTLMVSLLWTGVVVEALALGADRRVLLHADGRIQDIKPDAGQRGRIIYLSAEKALELHKTKQLVPLTIADQAGWYRFAAKGEAAEAALPLPLKYGEP